MPYRLSVVWSDIAESRKMWVTSGSYTPLVLRAFWLKHDQRFVWKVDDKKTKEARKEAEAQNFPWRYWKDAEDGLKEVSRVVGIEIDMGMQVGMYARLTDIETLLTAAPVERDNE